MSWFDTLKSLITGLGSETKDKTTTLGFALRVLTDAELNAMHRSDWLARKIVDIIPNDMTREWRSWQASSDIIEAVEAVEKNPLISVQAKVNEAMRKARLLRGSLIYMGIRNANPAEPLDLDAIKVGDLQYLNVINRSEVSTGEINLDATSEFFKEPSYYEVRGASGSYVRIHPSRVVRFIGADILDENVNADGWGDSILQIVYDAVQNSASVQQHVAALIPEAKVDVIYIPTLSEFLKDPVTTRQLTDRFAYANQIKSSFNMVLLEGDGESVGERWEQKQISFAQLPEIIQQYLQIASGAADIPITRLLGQSPSGLQATGDGDTRNYYDNVTARQNTELKPRLHRLDEVIIRSAVGSRPPEVHYTWNPLWGLSDTERATNFKMKADAARAIVGSGGASPALIPIDALSDSFVNTMIEDGSLPGLEEAIKKYGTLAEQMEEEGNEEDVLASATPPAPNSIEEDPEEGDDPSNVVNLRPATKATGSDAEPRTLYVRRDVLNVEEITRWAKSQGMVDVVEDLHVTIAYSKTPMDWIKAGNASDWGEADGKLIIPEGGPRVVEPLGDMSAVLLFSSSTLCWRHEEIVRAGASHDYPDYIPHVSLTKSPIDLANVVPYRGKIILGPEIFEEVKP